MAEAPDNPLAGKLAVSVPVTATVISTSIRTVWRLLAAKELTAIRCGRSVKVTVKSIEAFVARGGTKK